MGLINTKIHGVLDYLVATILLGLPQILNLNMSSAEGQIPMILGLLTIIYSLLTAYELSFAKLIPMRLHLAIDFASGVFLAASPWLFHFSEHIYLPHVILGITEILVSVFSSAKRKELENNLI